MQPRYRRRVESIWAPLVALAAWAPPAWTCPPGGSPSPHHEGCCYTGSGQGGGCFVTACNAPGSVCPPIGENGIPLFVEPDTGSPIQLAPGHVAFRVPLFFGTTTSVVTVHHPPAVRIEVHFRYADGAEASDLVPAGPERTLIFLDELAAKLNALEPVSARVEVVYLADDVPAFSPKAYLSTSRAGEAPVAPGYELQPQSHWMPAAAPLDLPATFGAVAEVRSQVENTHLLVEDVEGKLSALSRLESSLLEVQSQVDDLAGTPQMLLRLEAGVAAGATGQELAATTALVSDLGRALSDVTGSLQALQATTETTAGLVRAHDETLMDVRERLNGLEVSVARVESKIDALLTKLETETPAEARTSSLSCANSAGEAPALVMLGGVLTCGWRRRRGTSFPRSR